MSGTKVTSDPLSQLDAKVENPGTVTSDSLAGESIREGGDFAATSSSRGVSDQPSSSTTTNTTDTSGATKLDPAHSRADRSDGITYDRAEGFAGAGAPNLNRGVFNAPSKPTKSAPVQEEGFDGPNASFNGEIGGKNDPGRVALQKMELETAATSGDTGSRATELDSNTQYDALGGDTSA